MLHFLVCDIGRTPCSPLQPPWRCLGQVCEGRVLLGGSWALLQHLLLDKQVWE